LYKRFWEDLAPAGSLEEMLVRRTVECEWRLRRVLTAEAGEIVLSVDNGCWRRRKWSPASAWATAAGFIDVVLDMRESVVGNDVLRMYLEEVRANVQRDGKLTEAALQRLRERFGNKPNSMVEELTKFRALLSDNPDGLSAEVLKAKHQEAVLKYIDGELRLCSYLRRYLEKREEKEEETRQAASVLPSTDVLDKILRYETALARQLCRAMHQLERLQRMRKGEFVPAPVTMEVSQR